MEHTFQVYVPTPQASRTTLSSVPGGAGIVGSPEHGHLRIDYAGTRAGQLWADRVRAAAEQHSDRSATITRSWVPDDDMVLVGEFDGQRIVPHPWRASDIQGWVEDFSPRQLETTG